MTSLLALHEALDAAARALVLAEAGRAAEAQAVLWEATAAAAGAFPWCSFEAIALEEVLGAVADMAAEETTTRTPSGQPRSTKRRKDDGTA